MRAYNDRDRISSHNKYYNSLSIDEQKEKTLNSESVKWTVKGSYKKDEKCPSCANSGVLTGKLISVSGGKGGESEIIQHLNVLPTELKCFCCNLELNNLELDIVKMRGQYKIEEKFDPKEYFDITFEPDFDYGND